MNSKPTKKILKTISFPEIKTYHAKLLSHEIISVQPLSLPNGRLFHIEFGFLRVINFDKDELAAYDKELDNYLNDRN